MSAPRDTYTHGHHASVLRSHDARTAQNSAAYLLPYLRAGTRILDVGCGPGSITRDFAEIVDPAVVIGIENVPDPLDLARANTTAAGVANVRFELRDVYALDYPDASYDVVHAHQVLQHLADPVAALREMRRVCAPGGIVAARDADYAAMTWYPATDGLTRWVDLYRTVARRNGGEPDAGRRLLSWARQAGFERVTASASVWCYADLESRMTWGMAWAERVTHSTLAAQAIERDLASADTLAALASAWTEWAEQPDGWFTVLHGEILGHVD